MAVNFPGRSWLRPAGPAVRVLTATIGADKLSPADYRTMSEGSDAADPPVRHTTDRTLVRSVVEERGGYPAHAPESEGQGDQGLLRIGFRDRNEDLKEITWEAFFEEFDEKDLAFVYAPDGSEVAADRPVALRKRASVAEE